MPTSIAEKILVFLFRLAMGWTFLYAASTQAMVLGWSVSGFLDETVTFHDLFAPFGAPGIAPITSIVVSYGHLLIGLSLVVGLMVRVSAAVGAFLMVIYWMAHMDWPYVTDVDNFIVDFHLVYAGVLALLIVRHAGHVWGLDAVVTRLAWMNDRPRIKALFT